MSRSCDSHPFTDVSGPVSPGTTPGATSHGQQLGEACVAAPGPPGRHDQLLRSETEDEHLSRPRNHNNLNVKNIKEQNLGSEQILV